MTVIAPSAPIHLTARGAATRARIIATAADLIGAHGVGGTSLDDVMAASTVSKSQLYHYFADKDALIREVITLQTSRVLAAQRSLMVTLDSLADLRRWRNSMVDMNNAVGGKGGCPIGSLANELADHSELARTILAGSFESWEAQIAEGLDRLSTRDALRPGANVPDIATAVLSAIQGGLLLAKTTRTTRPLELALDMALHHVEDHLVMA